MELQGLDPGLRREIIEANRDREGIDVEYIDELHAAELRGLLPEVRGIDASLMARARAMLRGEKIAPTVGAIHLTIVELLASRLDGFSGLREEEEDIHSQYFAATADGMIEG